MDEKDLNLDKNLDKGLDASDETKTEEINAENNDNWEFEAKAPTLDTNVIANDEFEIEIPKSAQYETAPRPTKKPAPQQTNEVQKKKIKGDKPLFAVLGVVVALIIAASVVLGSLYYTKPNIDEKMNPGNVAMTVGKTPVSIGMYNYYYTCISQNFISYASYGYYDIDTTKDYSAQTTTDEDGNEITWAQKFENDTLDQIQYITAYYEDAVAHGVTLTDEQEENIKTSLDSIKSTAGDAGKTADEYISETYGDYCGLATLQKMLEQCYVAENYYQEKQLSTTVTVDEEKEYFDEHQNEYKNVSFAYLQVPYASKNESEVPSFSTESRESGIEKCNGYAEEIKSVDDVKKLIPTACSDLINSFVEQGYAEDAEACAEMLAANVEVSITASETGFIKEGIDWLFSDDVKVGECKAFDDSDNAIVYVIYKTSEPEADDTMVYSVRHILVTPESEEEASEEESKTEDTHNHEGTQNVEYTDEEWAAAENKAQKILDEYNNGDKTELAFAKLAEDNSDDTESTSKGSSGIYGGLCAGVKEGQMVPTFEEWSIDPERQYGDVGIVKSEYGYHIMYFVENVEKYLNDCKSAIQSQKEDEFIKSAKIKKHSGAMKKVKVAKPAASSSQTEE